MRRYTAFLITAGLLSLVFILAGFSGDELDNSSGAPAKNTNSPGDGQNCTHCMGGSATAVTGWITSDVPATGYVPGNTYTITATGTGTGRKGFEISPQDLAGNLIGTLIAGSGNKLVGSNIYVTHSSAVTANPAVWHFQWTAPATGVGDVTFYGSFAVTQSATKTTTMVVSQSTVGMTEISDPEWRFYPNPAHEKILMNLSAFRDETIRVDLLSLRGEVLRNLVHIGVQAGTGTFEVSLGQPSGIYLVRLTTPTGTQVRKLMVD